MSKTITYGIRKAPPPFSNAVNGNLQIFPKPTDIEMQDMRNSKPLPHVGRSVCASYINRYFKRF